MRHAAKVDSNHKEIRTQLRSAGYRVWDTSRQGEGFPDLVVALKNGRVALLFEIKPVEGGEVTKDECEFMLKIVEPVYRMADTLEKIDAILQTVERN